MHIALEIFDKYGAVVTEEEIAWRQVCEEMHGKTLTGVYAHWCESNNGAPIDETCAEFSTCRCFGEIDFAVASRANEISQYLADHAKFYHPCSGWGTMWKQLRRADKLRIAPYLHFLHDDGQTLILRSIDNPNRTWEFTPWSLKGNNVHYIYNTGGDESSLFGNLPRHVVESMILSPEILLA